MAVVQMFIMQGKRSQISYTNFDESFPQDGTPQML